MSCIYGICLHVYICAYKCIFVFVCLSIDLWTWIYAGVVYVCNK